MSRELHLACAAALIVVAAALAALTWTSIGAVNSAEPLGVLAPETAFEHAASAAPEQRPRRVVLVVLDGLRRDTSASMPSLVALGKKGYATWANAPLPSFSRPSYATIASGTPPERTGIRTNRYPDPVPVDTIFARARAAGVKVHGYSDHTFWKENLGPHFDSFDSMGQLAPDEMDAAILKALDDDAPQLVVVHLTGIDHAGHEHGAASDAYLEATKRADARLAGYLANLDLATDAVIVTADHGHLDAGGHGGDEDVVRSVPLVLAGKGVRNGPPLGPESAGSVGVIAPTIAVLMGLPYPEDMSLHPALGAIDPGVLGKDYMKARNLDWTNHRKSYEALWLDETQRRWSSEGKTTNPVVDAAEAPNGANLATLLSVRAATLDAIAEHNALGRTPLIAILFAVLIVLLTFGLVRGNRLLPLLGLPIYGGAFMLIHTLLGQPLSYSAIQTYSVFLTKLGIAAGGAFVVYALVNEGLVRLSRPESIPEARLFHFSLAAITNVSVASSLWLIFGYFVDAPLPSATILFTSMLSTIAAGVFTVVVALAWLLPSGKTPQPPNLHAQSPELAVPPSGAVALDQ